MFACIYGQTLPKSDAIADDEARGHNALVNLAFSFSPLVERTTDDTVVLNIEGQEHLYPTAIEKKDKGDGWIYEIANRIARCASRDCLKVNVAVAANPDAAIHAARAFKGITVFPQGEERTWLSLSLIHI